MTLHTLAVRGELKEVRGVYLPIVYSIGQDYLRTVYIQYPPDSLSSKQYLTDHHDTY